MAVMRQETGMLRWVYAAEEEEDARKTSLEMAGEGVIEDGTYLAGTGGWQQR